VGFGEHNWPVIPAIGYGGLSWWKEKQDIDLLVGVYRHGFGKYASS
jgi:hypothetical protein